MPALDQSARYHQKYNLLSYNFGHGLSPSVAIRNSDEERSNEFRHNDKGQDS